jgi:NTP pyrophosphatase (non-canonical NTP hydrolase)
LRAIDHFGIQHQEAKLLEELGELIVEISREDDGRSSGDSIREELADVIIMCEQMRTVYGAAKVDKWIERKLARLEGMIKENV